MISFRNHINKTLSNCINVYKPITINSLTILQKQQNLFYSTNYDNKTKIKTKSTKEKIKDNNNNNKTFLNIKKDKNIDYSDEYIDKFNKKKQDENNKPKYENQDDNNDNEDKDNDIIESGKERIQKIIARSGIASRRKAEELIQDGKVKLNGVVVTFDNLLASPTDQILVNDKPIKITSPKLWMHFKTTKVLTTANDPMGRDCLIPILKKVLNKDHLITIGRLDYYSEGLILLTNDGELARHLELPDNEFQRTYRVRIFGKLTNEMKSALTNGITIDGIKYKPIKIEIDTETDSNTWLNITLKEGKKREIRTMLEYFNVKVLRLIRISYGPYELPKSLKHGETIEVPIKNELKQFIQKFNSKERLKRKLILQQQKK